MPQRIAKPHTALTKGRPEMATAEATTEFDAPTKELGDKIVGLTLLQAKALADYLKEVHASSRPAAG